jgi:plastocyanin
MIHRRFAALACAIAFAGVLSACGADPNDLTEGLNGPETTTTVAEEVVTEPAPVEVTTTTLPSAPEITIENLTFSPPRIAVKPGTEVTFTNNSDREHQVVLGSDVSEVLGQGDSVTIEFNEPGEFTYSDAFFSAMSGTVVVG